MEEANDLPLIALPQGIYFPVPLDACVACEQNRKSVVGCLIVQRIGTRSNVLSIEPRVEYGVYHSTGVFSRDRFGALLRRLQIDWPLTITGLPKTDRETFKAMTLRYPELRDLAELRNSLAKIRSSKLEVGPDGRNQCLLSPFGTKTGRNTPSSSRWIFGQAGWLRSLIRPPVGCRLAYLDYRQQEFAIAATLSGDLQMQQAYRTGDPYLNFAQLAGALSPDADPEESRRVRSLYKTAALGVLFGMTAKGLAQQTGLATEQAERLIRDHRRAFGAFWRWQEQVLNQAYQSPLSMLWSSRPLKGIVRRSPDFRSACTRSNNARKSSKSSHCFRWATSSGDFRSALLRTCLICVTSLVFDASTPSVAKSVASSKSSKVPK